MLSRYPPPSPVTYKLCKRCGRPRGLVAHAPYITPTTTGLQATSRFGGRHVPCTWGSGGLLTCNRTARAALVLLLCVHAWMRRRVISDPAAAAVHRRSTFCPSPSSAACTHHRSPLTARPTKHRWWGARGATPYVAWQGWGVPKEAAGARAAVAAQAGELRPLLLWGWLCRSTCYCCWGWPWVHGWLRQPQALVSPHNW